MTELSPLARPDVGHIPNSLEDKLIWLTGFGKPTLFRMDGGWHTSLAMHVASKGSTFKIESDYKHQSPSEAVDECISRMVATLKDLENTRG